MRIAVFIAALLASMATMAQERTAFRKLIVKPTAEQKTFLKQVESNDLAKAFFQFNPAFSKTEFGKSSNGKALHALLAFQNGLQLVGLEEVLAIPDPSSVSPILINMWKQAAPSTHPVWNQFWTTNWNSRWSSVFGNNLEIRIVSKNLNGFADADKINALLAKAQIGTVERNALQWQLILGMSAQDTAKAGTSLATLMKQPNPAVGQDLMNLTAARMLFENGYLDGAIKYYEKVTSASDYWFEAQEEKAWSYLRKGQTQDALAITQALNHSSIVWLSGPEASFLRSLAQLKVCDYKGVVKTLEKFKENFRERSTSLELISKDANTPEVLELIAQRGQGPIVYSKMGSSVKKLPRWALRDRSFGNMASFHGGIISESKLVDELYQKSQGWGDDRVGAKEKSEQLKKSMEQQASRIQALMMSRVQALAKEEVEETQRILSRLQIVEAEMIQQSTVLEKLAARNSKSDPQVLKGRGKQSKYQIAFPDSEEVWFDELANYNVDVKSGCEGVKR